MRLLNECGLYLSAGTIRTGTVINLDEGGLSQILKLDEMGGGGL